MIMTNAIHSPPIHLASPSSTGPTLLIYLMLSCLRWAIWHLGKKKSPTGKSKAFQGEVANDDNIMCTHSHSIY